MSTNARETWDGFLLVLVLTVGSIVVAVLLHFAAVRYEASVDPTAVPNDSVLSLEQSAARVIRMGDDILALGDSLGVADTFAAIERKQVNP